VTPEEILAKAAEDMAKYGHTKGSFYSSKGEQPWETAPACAYGSMSRVAHTTDRRGIVSEVDHPAIGRAAAKLADVIRPHLAAIYSDWHPDRINQAESYNVITQYNDHDNISAEDMILRFKEAANG
jgi:hypothetical protein